LEATYMRIGRTCLGMGLAEVAAVLSGEASS
jgi:hypothetical protein